VATTGHLTSSYPGWRASSLGAITERVEQHLVFDLAGPLAGLAVLDVGCGDGTYAIEAAARGARAVGLDADPAMLREAERRARERGVAVDLHEGRAEDLPFGDVSFDVVFAVTVLCFVADAAGAIREMARVLVPGGRLVLGELGRFSTWAAWRRLSGWLGSTTWRGARFRSAQDLRGFLRGAGLEVERVTGAVYYPPIGVGARFLAPIDRMPAAVTTLGAAFLTAAARKPGPDKPQGEPS
jgi:2-polyprenyl-3-methyl-5-hydroxy-6-metoxy-1,4-benzoquinol methylase